MRRPLGVEIRRFRDITFDGAFALKFYAFSVVSTGVRLLWLSPLAALCVAACIPSPPGPHASPAQASVPAGAARVDPANFARLWTAFPPGYEVAHTNGALSPAAFWGLGASWSAHPAQCASLADPLGGQDGSLRGLSGSGAGGIVYVAVAAGPAAVPDPAVVDDCARWSVRAARTTGTVELVRAAAIDGATTLAMSTETRTVVEGGSQTEARAQTATAYLGDFLVFVTVVTDPGSTQPALPPDFASDFLVRSVATLRGSPPGH